VHLLKFSLGACGPRFPLCYFDALREDVLRYHFPRVSFGVDCSFELLVDC